MNYSIEFSRREIEYIIWALHTESENPIIAGALEKMLDALKLGERVMIIRVERIKELEEELMQAVTRKRELEEKIKALESEKDNLLAEIEVLKAISSLESRAAALESDITKLREEKKLLEEKVTSAST